MKEILLETQLSIEIINDSKSGVNTRKHEGTNQI